MSQLYHVSEPVLDQLRSQISENVGRYTGAGFRDLSLDPGWAISRDLDVDLGALSDLDGTERSAAADLDNSRVIMRALGNLSPSLANEEQIWVRLSHIEGFEYSRDRWLAGRPAAELESQIGKHFFAPTQTGIRDDHALSRLWWNGYVARHCMPENPDRALVLLLSSADVRTSLVERIWLTGRRKLAAGVFRAMERDERLLATEKNFREFMKSLNMLGGGIVFETMTPDEIDDFIDACADRALDPSKSEAVS